MFDANPLLQKNNESDMNYIWYNQARRQDLVAGGAKTRKGGHIF